LSNFSKTWFFLCSLALSLLLAGHVVGGRQGLLAGFVLALGIIFFVYFRGEERILRRLNCEPLEGRDPWGLLSLVDELSQKAKIPTPQVFLIPTESPTVLSVGRNWSNGKVLVSTGLIKKLSKDEMKAAIAHQIVSIRRLNTLSFTVGGVFSEVFLRIVATFDRIFTHRRKKQSGVFEALLSPLTSVFVRGAANKGNYFETDKAAASLIENPESLAKVLFKLRSYSQTVPYQTPPWISHMFIVSPLPEKGKDSSFITQPSIESRIQSLTGKYPI
jgi:heat shock protein HtpX